MKNRIILTVFLSLCFIVDLLAQPPLPNNDSPDVTDNPIHFLVYPFLILGAYLGFKVIKKK